MLKLWSYALVWVVASVSVIARAQEGLRFERYRLDDGAVMRVVRADPNKYRVVLAANERRTLQTIQTFRAQYPASVALINAGFFQESGAPAGFFKYKGQWWCQSLKPRAVLGIGQKDDKQSLLIDRMQKRDGHLVSWWGPAAWWQSVDNIVGGAPVLLYAGEKVDFREERLARSFENSRYARSAFCVTGAGDMLMVHVSGSGRLMHKIGRRQGLSLSMLADKLHDLGCVDALNLDGGGSAVMMVDEQVFAANGFWQMATHPIANVLLFEPIVASE